MADEIKVETVRTGSFEMDYFKFGNGSDSLVILPGVSVQSVMLLPNIVAAAYKVLTDDFTVYVVDRRKNVTDGYSIAEMAEDTAEAIEAIGLKRVSIMGVSQGGMIAMMIALTHPDLVKNLVLACSSAHVKEKTNQLFKEWMRLAEIGDKEALYLRFGETVYSREMFESSRDLLIKASESVTEEELKRFIIITKSMLDFDIRDELDKISCPVFVIGSDDDQVLLPDASPGIMEHLTKQDDHILKMYSGYGHAVFDEAPDFKESMLGFLRKV